MPNSETRPRLRAPRLLARVNGAVVSNAVAARVLSNNHYAADRFRLTVALGQNRAADWMSAERMDVEIGIAQDGTAAWLIEGEADQIELDAHRRLLVLSGRDLTARLIEARTQESFSNRTSSEIAGILARRRGLVPSVTPTTTPVGRYWQLQRDRITLDQFSRATTEWDLLVALASLEGFDVWVAGTTLHFHPRQAAAPATPLRPEHTTALRLDRALTLARDIEVVVKSWNARQQQAFIRRARRSGGAGGGGREPQRHVLVVPNLTPDEALKLAQRKLEDLTRHERVITADMPGTLSHSPRQRIALSGTGTDFDQDYFIDEIDRSLSPTTGFIQTLRARNITSNARATTPAARLVG